MELPRRRLARHPVPVDERVGQFLRPLFETLVRALLRIQVGSQPELPDRLCDAPRRPESDQLPGFRVSAGALPPLVNPGVSEPAHLGSTVRSTSGPDLPIRSPGPLLYPGIRPALRIPGPAPARRGSGGR